MVEYGVELYRVIKSRNSDDYIKLLLIKYTSNNKNYMNQIQLLDAAFVLQGIIYILKSGT